MNEQDYWTVEAMEKYGGSFVKCLATLCRQADPVNLSRIKATWPQYWVEYQEMGKELEEKEKKEVENSG